MVFLAFAFGLWLAMRRGRSVGVDPAVITDLTVWIMVSSLAGARAAYVITHTDEFRGRWLDAISPIQSDGTIGIAGLVVLGGVVAAIPVAAWFVKKRKIRFLKMMDIMIPSLAFGIAIGRMGCFLNGCCFGKPTQLPWGVVFPRECLAGSVYPGVSIHPTQVYEIIYATAIGLFLLWRTKSQRFEGELFHLFLVFYGVFRIFNESVRFYEPGMVVFSSDRLNFTVSMAVSVLMIAAGGYYLIQGWQKRGSGAR